MSNKWKKTLVIALICIFSGIVIYMAFTYKEILGTDDKIGVVVKQYAEKAGVSERNPYINTNKGDLLLFLFCISGLIAGFYLGYNWKKIISEKPDISEVGGMKTHSIGQIEEND